MNLKKKINGMKGNDKKKKEVDSEIRKPRFKVLLV